MSRRRWLYTAGGRPLAEPVEITEDWKDESMQGGHASEEEVYGHTTATDGTDLSTRRRHREYMKRNGLTTADDFKETWRKADIDRATFYTTGGDSKERRETIARTYHQLESRKRRR